MIILLTRESVCRMHRSTASQKLSNPMNASSRSIDASNDNFVKSTSLNLGLQVVHSCFNFFDSRS